MNAKRFSKGVIVIGGIAMCGLMFASEIHASEITARRGEIVLDNESAAQRLYRGGADEEDLVVLPSLPEALRKIDRRALEAQVFKELYNEDMKITDEPTEADTE